MTCRESKTKPKIIYLCYMPLTQKREKDFFIKEMADVGFLVEYWDLTELYFQEVSFTGEIERSYVRKIKDYEELEKLLRAQYIKQCFFVMIITYGYRVIKLYRILTKYKCYLIFFARAGLPIDSLRKSLLRKFFDRPVQYLSFHRLLRAFLEQFAKFYMYIGLIKQYDLVFASGTVEASQYNSKSRVVIINHFDYDECLVTTEERKSILDHEYCVFLDDNLVYDTDFKILGIKTISATSYFQSLSSFFDLIEKKLHLKVIVAAHPKANYIGYEFGNRKIIKGKTSELVKNCNFAIAHFSTSISFAVLYGKPLLFICTNEMKKMSYFKNIEVFASILDANILNIDEIYGDTELKISGPNLLRYKEYMYRYLTSPATEGRLSATIFKEHMTNLAASR